MRKRTGDTGDPCGRPELYGWGDSALLSKQKASVRLVANVNLVPMMEVEVHRQRRRGSLRGGSAQVRVRKERVHKERVRKERVV